MLLKYFWLTLPVKKCKFVVCISEQTKQEVLKECNCDIAKIKVIYNAIDERFIYSEKTFKKNKPIILHIGFTPNKNLTNHIKAIKNIECKFILLGKPDEIALNLLKIFNIDYEILFGLSLEEVITLYKNIDILLYCSTYEGFGLPIVEAQTTGRVVITSNTSCMPEVAGEGAIFVDPISVKEINEAIHKVINDDDYRNELIRKGIENSKRFSVEKMVNSYAELYNKIV